MVMLWGCRQISNRLGRLDEEEKAGDEMMRMMYVPGGVMSVATANALKVKWPDVCQKASVSDWFSCLLYLSRIGAVEAWSGWDVDICEHRY